MTLKRASRATKLLLSALLLAASALLLAGPEAIANQRLCAYDCPCIDALFFSNKGRINVTWTGDWDAYNVRWSVVRGGRVIYLGQFDVGRDSRQDRCRRW